MLTEKAISSEELMHDLEANRAHYVRRCETSKRIVMTPNGPVHLTPTEMAILRFLERCAGRPVSKALIAAALGRNEKTIDRLLSHLRRDGIIVSKPMYSDNGGQLANIYLVADDVTYSF